MITDNRPHISIIVRTKDRPKLLKEALESIFAQTYRPIEVVLVNDGGCDLDIEEIKSILIDISLNYIKLEKNTGRAHAGNVGIENAKGKYIGFLDDDDELYPEHIEALLMFLMQSDHKAAYTDTELIYRDFSHEEVKMADVGKSIFSRDFSYNELLLGNYIPLNSLCFSGDIFKFGYKFDECFDLYEDWDLLIRVAESYPFYHIKKITAKYIQWSKDLQINRTDKEIITCANLKIFDKHRDKFTSQIILNTKNNKETIEMEGVKKDEIIKIKGNAISQLEEKIKEKETLIKDLNNRIIGLNNKIKEKDKSIELLEENIEEIQKTLGWQALERFRRLREKILPLKTRRRKVYDLGIKTLKHIEKEGFALFGKKMYFKYNKNKYKNWTTKNEPDYQALEDQKNLSREFKIKPLISIITPVFNPQEKVFIKTIESVINQTYDNWELCLANASSEPYVSDIIDKYKNFFGNKIKIKNLEKNYGISKNSNEAISLATGDFIALLDHDDTLAPFALFEVVKAVNDDPDVDFIYSDRDKITVNEKRHEPFFKPDWSPALLLSQNYLCHLNVFKKALIDKIGGFREGFDGSQDYDLVLRVTELTNKIIHIPKILYHWRIIAGSVAGDSDAKPYAYSAAVKALKEAFSRRGWDGTITQSPFRGLYEIKYRIQDSPKVSIILPVNDKIDSLNKCIISINEKTSYKNYELIIVENTASYEGYSNDNEDSESIPNLKFFRYSNPFNLSEIYNYAVSQTDSDFILFLNDNSEVITKDWLERLIGFTKRENIGATGAKLVYPDNTIYTAGYILDEYSGFRNPYSRFPRKSLGYACQLQSVRNVSAVSWSCMMVRREVFEKAGGFDPVYASSFGDIDFCLKLREKGYLIVYEPYVELYIHKSLSPAYNEEPDISEKFKKERDGFLVKWGNVLKKGDPYHNPNLVFVEEFFGGLDNSAKGNRK